MPSYLHRIFFLGLFFFISCITFGPKKSEMQSVTGKIIKSYVEKKHKYRSVYKGHNDFYPRVEYEYEVDGKMYQAERIGFWNNAYNSQAKAETITNSYPVGKELIVYYEKENPTKALLEVDDDTSEED